MLSFKFQSDSMKIEDFEINPFNTSNPISNKDEGLFFTPLIRKVLKSVLDVKLSVNVIA